MSRQNTCILKWLARGNSLTAVQALHEFGCFRLAARIAELRDKGHTIGKRMVRTEGGAYIAEYYMTTPNDLRDRKADRT